ncbi:hypothetical protein AHAS_Ahas19G0385300 [Arachis hypogaea]
MSRATQCTLCNFNVHKKKNPQPVLNQFIHRKLMTMSLKCLSSSMDPINLDSKSDLLRPVAISLLLCPIISMTTLFTTSITFFSFFSEPMFSYCFSFHMSGNSDIAHCTNSSDVRESSHDVLMSKNLYCLLESGEWRVLRVVVELGLEDVVDVVGVGSDAVIEDVEVDASGG